MDEISNLTCSQKHYLLSIYRLSLKCDYVRVKELAYAMGVGKSSVTSMTTKLSELGYLDKTYYGQNVLTKKGYIIAELIYQQTERLRIFLREQLLINDERAAADATAIAVYASDSTVALLSEFLKSTAEATS